MNKWNSRKYKLAVWLCVLFTAIFILPWVTTLVLTLCGSPITFQLLTPELYVTLMTMLFASYFGANAAVKFATNGNGNGIKKGDNLSEAPGTGSGGQPPEPPEIPVNT